MCHVTFPSHEELFHHSCTQIKVENSELQDQKPINTNGKLLETFDTNQEDFKYDMDPPDEIESDSDYSPSKKKSKKSIVKKKEKKSKKSTKLDVKKKEIQC